MSIDRPSNFCRQASKPVLMRGRKRCVTSKMSLPDWSHIGKNQVIAYLHVTGRRYAVSIDGQRIVEDSRDPECDAARALLAPNITSMVKLLDANTGMHRSTVNIEKAAQLRTYDDSLKPVPILD